MSRTWLVTKDPNQLNGILEPTVNLVCLQRSLPDGLEKGLGRWTARAPAVFDAVLPACSYDLGPALVGLDEASRAWLATDVAVLLARFAGLAQVARFRLSFGTVRDDQCRKLHVDQHRVRLVTTYLGPGTEWVPNESVCREALDHPPDCPSDANLKIAPSLGAVRHARAGDVLLMKGAGHSAVPGAVHRSPPLKPGGETRVVLIASTVEAP